MTTMYEKEIVCAVCGEVSKHMGVASTNAFGSPDLDTRPPEMRRSTIFYWVQRCPSCGYCASDISSCDEAVKDLVRSDVYQSKLNDASVPQLAASFLACSLVEEMCGNFSDAAWAAIHAAWVCDDQGQEDLAVACRKQAIEKIAKANERKQVIAEQEGASEAITIDLMRRAGLFDEALALSKAVRGQGVEEIIERIAVFEESLILRQDVGVHTIAEALGG